MYSSCLFVYTYDEKTKYIKIYFCWTMKSEIKKNNLMVRSKKNSKGFTLAELLIVVAIIAVLVAIAIPIFTNQLEKSRRSVDLSNARSLQSVLAASVNDGTIQFNGSDLEEVYIYVTATSVSYVANGQSKYPSVNGVSSSASSDEIKKLVNAAGLTEDGLKVHCKQVKNTGTVGTDEGWKWYCVFILQDGTVGVTSGPGDASASYISGHGNFRSKALYNGYQNSAMARALRGEE